MKKLLAVLLALALVFSMSVVAFAGNSNQGTEPTAEEAPATDAEGNEVDVEVDSLPYYDEAAVEVRSANGDAEVLAETLELTDEIVAELAGTGYAIEDLTILAPVDVYIVGDASEVEFPIDVEISVEGATEDTPVVVLHKTDAGWEVVPSKVIAPGKVLATFNSLSPVVVLLGDGEPSNAYNTCAKDASCPLNNYSDVDVTAWYHDYVHYVVDKGLMGVDMTVFGPDWGVIRADFIQTLYRSAGSPAAEATTLFTDLAEAPEYAQTAISWAANEGLVEGNEGKVNANDLISREEAFTILFRYAKKLGLVGETYAVSMAGFDDYAEVSDWAADATMWGVASGLIEGDNGSLFPTRSITRAELATLLTRWETEITE